jgi:hypothetical protein
MKKILLLCVFLIASCSVKSVPTETPHQADPREQELRAVIAEAEPIMRSLLTALNAGDYTSYVRDFDDTARAANSEEQFKIFYEESCREKLGPYEEGKFQVHQVEKHPGYYMICYFVKFRNVGGRDPVVVAVQVTRYSAGLKISGVAYRHGLLGK